jgi:hypothetical protein
MTLSLNGLAGVLAWDFTCTNVLERKMDYNFRRLPSQDEEAQESKSEIPDELVAQTTPSTPNLSDVEVAQEALVPVDVANGDP